MTKNIEGFCVLPALGCCFNEYYSLLFQMTWIRMRDYHILTSGALTQTMDGRFGVVRGETGDWALRIRFVQLRDQGLYECQVSQLLKLSFSLETAKICLPCNNFCHRQT